MLWHIWPQLVAPWCMLRSAGPEAKVNQSGLPIAAIGQNMLFHEELQRSAHHADTAARETGRETIKVLRNARGRQ